MASRMIGRGGILMCCLSWALISGDLWVARVAADEHVVKVISDYEELRFVFEPQRIDIQPGDSVVWVNEVSEEHDMITYPDGFPEGAQGFQSPRLTEAGERYVAHFEVPGTYDYHCTPHLVLGMRGQVIVGSSSDRTERHQPSRAEIKAYNEILLEFFDEDQLADLTRRDGGGVGK